MSMSDAKAATSAAELERQILSCMVPKNEREHWACNEIQRLRALVGESTFPTIGTCMARLDNGETEHCTPCAGPMPCKLHPLEQVAIQPCENSRAGEWLKSTETPYVSVESDSGHAPPIERTVLRAARRVGGVPFDEVVAAGPWREKLDQYDPPDATGYRRHVGGRVGGIVKRAAAPSCACNGALDRHGRQDDCDPKGEWVHAPEGCGFKTDEPYMPPVTQISAEDLYAVFHDCGPDHRCVSDQPPESSG